MVLGRWGREGGRGWGPRAELSASGGKQSQEEKIMMALLKIPASGAAPTASILSGDLQQRRSTGGHESLHFSDLTSRLSFCTLVNPSCPSFVNSMCTQLLTHFGSVAQNETDQIPSPMWVKKLGSSSQDHHGSYHQHWNGFCGFWIVSLERNT